MRIVVTGATGTIGSAVCATLHRRGNDVVALSRDAARARALLGDGVEVHIWARPTDEPPPGRALEGADAVINLLGEPVAQRWTAAAKQRIRESRTLTTWQLVNGLLALSQDLRPKALVSQSATGFYGPTSAPPIDEQSPAGHDFLAEVVAAWEAEAMGAEPSVRVVTTRTGVVLSPSGGALAKMLPFFRAGIGGPVAGGKQWVPWVHMDDVVAGLIFCVDDGRARGPVNLVAPGAVDNAQLSKALGKALHRPALLPVPALALQLLYGEMAEMVTTGQHVIPVRLTDLGFVFRYPELGPALADVLGSV